MSKDFSVNFWGSHPNRGNDDCYTGADYETLREAAIVFHSDPSKFTDVMSLTDCEYVELTGPDIYEVRRNPEFVAPSVDLDDWQAEIAREEGMLQGIEAYNDHMGC